MRAPSRRHAALRLGWVALLLGVAFGAEAVIPEAGRTMKAIAAVNRASGRTEAIQLELTMRIGGEAPVAKGELISHPSGLARLELRGFEGRVDRYLLSGDELLGAKNGRPLPEPRPLLQPFFLLQPDSETTLRAAIESFGIRSDAIGLATCGEEDCFVIGDPRLSAPLPMPRPEPDPEGVGDELPPVSQPAAFDDDQDLSLAEDPEVLEGPLFEGPLPRLWVDTRELQVKRIDRADGVFVIFGPASSFGRLKVPSWFEVHEPSEPWPVRFEVERAVSVNAPPKAFGRAWLTPPLSELGGPAQAPDAPAPGSPSPPRIQR